MSSGSGSGPNPSHFPIMGQRKTPPPSEARPSASIILLSPRNEILLLSRVRTSTSFPSAHVFPGGNLSEWHDGDIPNEKSAERHADGRVYRMGAIRECFEESGVLLARDRTERGRGLLDVSEAERTRGRKEVHSNTVRFGDWLTQHDGVADTDGLVPFSRWITPGNIPRRFTTQMYLYFLPLDSVDGPDAGRTEIVPTPDDGVEHTTASFLPADEWLRQAQTGEIVLFPPQFFLLSLLAPLLDKGSGLQEERDAVMRLVDSGSPPWRERCISPTTLGKLDDRVVLGLDKPGREIETQGLKRAGDKEHVVLLRFDPKTKVPRDLEVMKRSDVLARIRQVKI